MTCQCEGCVLRNYAECPRISDEHRIATLEAQLREKVEHVGRLEMALEVYISKHELALTRCEFAETALAAARAENERLREAYDSQEVQFVHTQASYLQAYEDLKTQFDSLRARPDDGRVLADVRAWVEKRSVDGMAYQLQGLRDIITATDGDKGGA